MTIRVRKRNANRRITQEGLTALITRALLDRPDDDEAGSEHPGRRWVQWTETVRDAEQPQIAD